MADKMTSIVEISQSEINIVSGGIYWEAYIAIIALPPTIILIAGGNIPLLLFIEGGILAHGVACGIADYLVNEDAHKSFNKGLVSTGMGSLLFAMSLLAAPIRQRIIEHLGPPRAGN